MITLEGVDEAFSGFVGDPGFPCLAARGTLRRSRYKIGLYGTMGDAETSAELVVDLGAFATGPLPTGAGFTSFIAVFPERPPTGEREFEQRLWTELQSLHEHDDATVGWDPTVSADPDDANFSFSFGGRAFFVVGLHPLSSRLARRFRWPALVFNPQAQFARLRDEGRFGKLRSAIREREVTLQGSVNPNLADFGEESEARQYSGRRVEADWRCPFHHKAP